MGVDSKAMSGSAGLRRLLDERGVSYQTHYLHVSWRVGSKLYDAVDNLDGTVTVDNLTPEQAIAATLGGEQEKESIVNALESLARAISWTVPNDPPTVRDNLKDAWEAIDQLKGDRYGR